MAALATPTALAAQQLKHGDVNGDGVVSALDAQAILTAVVGLSLPPGYVVANGDANCDNTTVALDAQLVLSYVIGLSTSQYCVGASFGPGAITMSLRAGTATVPDTSLLINRGIWLRAVLTDAGGFNVQRPIAWTNATPEFVSIDTMRNDSAFVKATATAGTASVSASADGVTRTMPIRVRTSYAGIVIQPQRGDTIRQLNGTRSFTARSRDSVGTLSGFPTAFWTTGDANIATVPATASNSGTVTAISTGTTWVYATLSTNPAVKDSVPLTVALPPVNSCVANTGTLHTNATYTTPQTWTAATNPHHVSGSLQFNSGSRLTIEPGVLVCMTGSSYMYFNDGTRITAIGTVTNPITFTTANVNDLWAQIQLGNNSGARTDTSTFKNVVMERPYYGVLGYNDHVVLMDSVRIRDFGYYGMQLYAIGSRVSRTTIDTSRTGYNGTGAYLGPVTFEESTIRLGSGNGTGLYLYDSTTVRQVAITGGSTGIDAGGSNYPARLNNVTISGATSFGLELPYYYNGVHQTSANVQITGSRVGFAGDINSFAILFPDTTAQAALLGANLTDTVYLTGGYLKQRSLTLRPAAKWRVNGELVVDTLARLRLAPATRLEFEYAGIRVRNTGRMEIRGTAASPVVLTPRAGTQFYGLVFENPPAPGGVLPTPLDTSTIVNVRVDSAGGYCGFSTCSAINTYDRHAVLIDSARVRHSLNGAVSLNTPGSRIVRSIIDTTGNPTSSYAALLLTGRTLAETVTVRRSGGAGVHVGGSISDSARLRAIRIEDSEGVALQADGARILGDSGSVIAVANAYPFYGYIDSFGAIAKDTIAQLNLLGNTSDLAVILGRFDRGFRGRVAAGLPDTLWSIPQLRWQVQSNAYIDTLGRFMPRKGSRIGFWSGGMVFNRGGRLIARGTNVDTIVFEKYSPTGGTFNGIEFQNAGGATLDTSWVVNTRISDIEGSQCATMGCATLATNDRHVLIVDSTRIRQSSQGAVHLAAPGSRISRTVIDTAGSTSYAALALNRRTLAETTTVRRAGGTGVFIGGTVNVVADTVRLRGIQILNGLGAGLHAEGGFLRTDSGSVVISGNAYPFYGYIDNFARLAKDTISQLNLLGNVDNLAVIIGRSDRGFQGRVTAGLPDTLWAIPQLRWQIQSNAYIDTLGRFMPRKGSRIGFWSGGMVFNRGGRLIARGTNVDTIVFEKYSPTGGNFNGIEFQNAGGTTLDTSWVVNTRFSDIQGSQCATMGCATLATNDRHVLIVDSTRIRQSSQGAVHLAAPGSRISRTVIDTAGSTSYAALALNRRTLAETTTVRRAGGTGVFIGGTVNVAADTVRLRGIQILNGLGAGLHAEGGFVVGDSGSVVASGNAYPFYGYIDNFAALARDSLEQLNFVGNTDNVAYIIGRSDRPLRGNPLVYTAASPFTLLAIPQLRMEFRQQTYIDTLARFEPRKGSTITFENGGLIFQRGGNLLAVGMAGDSIRFRPARSGVNFYGMVFENPAGFTDPFPPGPPPTATSTMAFVKIDSTSGQSGFFGCCAAVNADTRHIISISDSRLRRNQGGAVWLGAPGSSINRVRVDTTGNPTTNVSAVAVNDSINVTDLTIYRSGQHGFYTLGRGINALRLRVTQSLGYGLYIDGDNTTGSRGILLRDSTVSGQLSFTADTNALGGVIVFADSVTLQNCVVRGNGTTASHHGVASGNTSIEDLDITSCNLLDNAGNGVNNANTTTAQFVIDAGNNWWGSADSTSVQFDGRSANVNIIPLCSGDCTTPSMMPMQQAPGTPALPTRSYSSRSLLHSQRRRRRSR